MGLAIKFDNVSKDFVLYHHLTGGIKNFLFQMPRAIRAMKRSRFEALKDVSFEIQQGEAVGIIGRNGAGKSTLLGLMAGVLKQTKGEIKVHGRISPLLELGTGFHHELTGRENIIMNGILMGLSRKAIYQKLESIIDFSGLADFIDQPIRTYSSGMLARLGFSVVSSIDPEILLIDEVLAVGDIEFKLKCLERIERFKREGVTIVLVSHALDEIQRTCDRLIWIGKYISPEHPSVRMVGSPQDVIEKYVEFVPRDALLALEPSLGKQ